MEDPIMVEVTRHHDNPENEELREAKARAEAELAMEAPGDENPREPYVPSEDEKAVAQTEALVQADVGPEVDEGYPVPRYASPIEAFLSDEGSELPSDVFKIRRVNGFAVDLVLQALPTPRYNRIIQDHTTLQRDKVTGERIETTRSRELKVQIIIESVQNLNFGDSRLMKKYKAQDPQQLVERMFLRGEIERIMAKVTEISGFVEEELEDQAGNS